MSVCVHVCACAHAHTCEGVKHIHQHLHYPIGADPELASSLPERLKTLSSDSLLIRVFGGILLKISPFGPL